MLGAEIRMPQPLVFRSHPPLLSQFHDDADIGDLIPFFIDELAGRLREIESSFEAGDGQTLQEVAHKVRGSAGGYGYPDLTDIASLVEDSLRDGVSLDDVRVQVEEFVSLCRAAIDGARAAD